MILNKNLVLFIILFLNKIINNENYNKKYIFGLFLYDVYLLNQNCCCEMEGIYNIILNTLKHV